MVAVRRNLRRKSLCKPFVQTMKLLSYAAPETALMEINIYGLSDPIISLRPWH